MKSACESRKSSNWCLFLCRGSNFRTEFSRISEIRSLIAKTVAFKALTATASPENKNNSMEEEHCFIIEKLPNKLNIKYIVQPAPETMIEMLHHQIEEVEVNGKCAKETIIFCKSYTDFVEVSATLVSELHDRGCFLVESLEGT